MAKAENAECRNIYELCLDKSLRQLREVCRNNQILSQQRACRLPKSTVVKCHDNSQLYRDIKCEEGREGCRDILKLCRDPVKAGEQKECRDFSKLC